MKKSNCVCIGKILKPRGAKGELAVKFEQKFRAPKVLFVAVYDDAESVPFFVETLACNEQGFGVLKFEDYNSPESVSDLTGKKIFIQKKYSRQSNNTSPNDYIGCSVVDKKYGELGVVENIHENSFQKLLQVKNGAKEILIPLVDSIVLKKEGNILHTEIPDGLTELF